MGKGKRLPDEEVLWKMYGSIVSVAMSSLGPGGAFSFPHDKQNFLAPSPLPLDGSYFTVSSRLPMEAAGWAGSLSPQKGQGGEVAADLFLGSPCQGSTSTVSRSGLPVSRHFQRLWLTGLARV